MKKLLLIGTLSALVSTVSLASSPLESFLASTFQATSINHATPDSELIERANSGQWPAAQALGARYYERREYKKAFRWLRSAADQAGPGMLGPAPLTYLSCIYRHGLGGVKKNIAKAQYYEQFIGWTAGSIRKGC